MHSTHIQKVFHKEFSLYQNFLKTNNNNTRMSSISHPGIRD
jgi:hypothetical protein